MVMIKTAEELYDDLFTKYISPNSTMWDTWGYIPTPRGRDAIIDVIKQLLGQDKKLKCGYSTTSIRGHHEYYILWK